MDVFSIFEKLKGIWSIENEEENGRKYSERGMQRLDYMGFVGYSKGVEFYLKYKVDKCIV